MLVLWRLLGVALTFGLLGAACSPAAETSLTTGASATTTRTPSPADPTETVADMTSGTPVPTTISEGAVGSTTTQPESLSYFVVAEEEARRLAVLEPAGRCVGAAGSGCDVPVVLEVDLPQRPHNLAAADGVAFATHPAAGSISRVEFGTGSIVTRLVGTEPHDIKYAPGVGVLYVADESGRRVFVLDPDSLDVLETVAIGAEPHDMAVDGDAIWVTLIGRSAIARVEAGSVEMVATEGLPHDLIVDGDGRVWFSSWDSQVLSVLDPMTGITVRAPAGVIQPHHFAIAPDGTVWVSDNGGSAVVGFGDPQVVVAVGPVPHHPAFVGDTLVVAVSGSGQAVQVRDGRVVGRTQLVPGLHGVAVMEAGRLAGP